MKKTFILITSLILLFLFTSCITPSNNVYKVTYYIDEEVYYETEVKENEKVENIKVPEIEYYELKNWLNKETNEPYDFSLPLKNNLELVANYSKMTNLAGGEEGKHYDFSNLTDEQLFETAKKLEDFLIDNAIVIPLYDTYKLSLLNERITYPVDLKYKGYELYSKFTGESVFRYGIKKTSSLKEINDELIFKGLYSYEYNEDLLSNKLVSYFAKEDPICLDDNGYIWKVYIDEGFKFSDGTDVKFEDFVNAYELNLQNETATDLVYNQIKNVNKYYKSECSREDVGIEYNYNEKSISFTFNYAKNIKEVKDLLTYKVFGPVPYFKVLEDADYSEVKYVGEYVLKSFENNILRYDKNPYYNNKSAASKTFDKIEYYLYDDDLTGYNMFKEELLDYINIPNEYFNNENNAIKTFTNTYGLQINLNEVMGNKNQAVLNKNFRKALYYGMDKNKYLDDNYILSYDLSLPHSYISNSYDVLYQDSIKSNPYNSKTSLTYYIKALDELISDQIINNDLDTIIELEVLYDEDIKNNFDLNQIFKDYEELFNSQEKYENIKISFKLTKVDSIALRYYQLYQGNYDLVLYNLDTYEYLESYLTRWGNVSNVDGARFYGQIFNKSYSELLIEFNNELFTYSALSVALNSAVNDNVYIKDGKLVELIYD